MIGFWIKKSFWDSWDNLGKVVLMNLIYFLLFSGFLSLVTLNQRLFVPGVVLFFILVTLYTGAITGVVGKINDIESIDFGDVKSSLKKNGKKTVLLGLFFSLLFLLALTGVRFYTSLNHLGGLLGAAFLFWFSLFLLGCSFYSLPVMNRLKGKRLAIVKKSALLSLDNPGFTLALALFSLFNLLLSPLTLFLLFGPVGILILQDCGVKLLLYKYDYLENSPEAEKRSIPWHTLLREEEEKVGYRTLRNTIFPWKD